MFIKDLNKRCYIKWRITHVCNYACSYCLNKNNRIIRDANTAMEDFQKCINAVPEILRIAKELNEINDREVAVDLIGGELSMYDDLPLLIDELLSHDEIVKINMTTNFYRDKEFYDNLYQIATKYNKQISITASFHYEFTDINTFFEKAIFINSKYHKCFYVETVNTVKNIYIDEFLKLCNDNDIYYNIDVDLSDPNAVNNLEKLTNKVIRDRYYVRFDDGTERNFTTRNQFLKEYGECSHDMTHILTAGMFCSRDHDYVYVDRDIALACHCPIPVAYYKVSLRPRTCYGFRCTICGHMSVSDDEADLENMKGFRL